MDTELLKRLNGRRFDQDDLTRIGVPSDTLMNYEKKAGLLLCSPQPGRGRARKFCLMDAYLLRLTGEIIAMSGSAILAVRAVNMLFMDMFDCFPGEMPSEEEFNLFKDDIQDDIYSAPDIFCERGENRFIYTEDLEEGFKVTGFGEYFDPFRVNGRVRRRLLLLNATQIFNDIDNQLFSVLESRYGRGGF